LVQFRDRKTLIIDMFFPNILIIIGFLISKFTLFKDGVPRNLSPDLLFESNPIYYNTISSNLSGSEISDFMNNYVISSNSSFFKNNLKD